MEDTIHFLASDTRCLCGESRLGLTVTRDAAKVLDHVEVAGVMKITHPVEGACRGCAEALAVTTLVNHQEPPQS